MKLALALAAAAALAALALPAAADAQGRRARCVVSSGGETYRGACSFVAERGGSFTVSPIGRRFLVGEVSDVSVAIVRRGVAEVRGLTSGGINSRWGEARRSSRDRACWVGSDFSVCAY
jgi:hypothetical protein